ncbi:MAG: hypothetical protein ACLFP9_00485 [Desulfonatronovibrio sp.]
MNSLSLLGYLLIFLVITIGNAIVFARLNEWKIKKDKMLDQELAETEGEYKKLMKEIKEARASESRLKAEMLELKKTIARENSAEQAEGKKSKSKKKPKNFMDILERDGVLTKEKIEKAENYLEKSDNPGLKLEDALVLLGLVSADELKNAQNEARGKK